MINGSSRDSARSSSTTLGPRHARPALPRLTTARAGVLRALIAAGESVTVAALADRLGQHPNTVREHLDALVADGRVERLRSAPTGRGRPAWLYSAAEGASNDASIAGAEFFDGGAYSSDAQEYVALAVALIDQVSATSPNPRGLARQAGERWGRALAEKSVLAGTATDPGSKTPATTPAGSKSQAVVSMLRDLRFEPRATDDPKTVRLTTCPFLDAARRNPEVVCEIHLGIVRGAMERLGGDPDATDLHEFAEPGACLLNLPDSR